MGKGLWIYKYPSGKKTWYARYTVKDTGSQKTLLIGDYPDISLADARLKNSEIRKIAKSGIDPKLHLANKLNNLKSKLLLKHWQKTG